MTFFRETTLDTRQKAVVEVCSFRPFIFGADRMLLRSRRGSSPKAIEPFKAQFMTKRTTMGLLSVCSANYCANAQGNSDGAL